MSPVSSSTFTCASARWRQHRGIDVRPRAARPAAGARCVVTTASTAGRVGFVVGASSPGIGSTSTRPGPRLHLAREQRDSPCAAGGPRTRTGDRGGAGSGGRRTRCRTSPTPRARASRRRGTPTPTTRRAGRRSSTSVFRMTRRCCACVDSTMREHLEAAGASRRRRRSSPSAARASTCRREPSSATAGVGIQSMPATNER